MQNLLNCIKQFCNWSGMEINMLKTKATAIDHATGEVPDDLRVESTSEAFRPENARAQPRE
eukprot:1149261-Rhodomonas_salina.1